MTIKANLIYAVLAPERTFKIAHIRCINKHLQFLFYETNIIVVKMNAQAV